MKKQYIFSFVLFFFFAYQCIAQENNPAPHLHIGNRYRVEQIKLNVAEAKPTLYRKYDKFYIAEIKDNQLENTNCIGKVRQGDFINIYMEKGKSVAQTMQTFLRYFESKETPKTPIYATLNSFQMELFLGLDQQYKLYAVLNIDFYKKDEKGDLVFVSHYHGVKDRKYDETFNGSCSKLIYTIFREALNTINIETSEVAATRVNYTDTTYLPKIGLYETVEDYRRNKPYKFNSYTFNNASGVLKTKNDSLLDKLFFGYCDGQDFYVFADPIKGRNVLSRALNRGRYLFIDNAIYDTEVGDYYTMLKEDYSAIFAEYPDFLQSLQSVKHGVANGMIFSFVQKLNREKLNLKAQNNNPITPRLHSANRYKTQMIILNANEAKRILYRKFDEFYLAEIKDNRIEKTNCIGRVREGKHRNLILEGDTTNITKTLQAFFQDFNTDISNKIPLYANLNAISIVVNDYHPYITMEMDLYKKGEKGVQILVSHYAGSQTIESLNSFEDPHASLIYKIFREAFNSINLERPQTLGTPTNYTDTTYLPKVGVYRTISDYCYNKSYLPNKYEVIDNNTTFKTESANLLYKRIFGYCDGLDFYIFQGQVDRKTPLMKSLTHGRYLFIADESLATAQRAETAKVVGAVVGAVAIGVAVGVLTGGVPIIVGTPSPNAPIVSPNSILYDTETGDFYTMTIEDYPAIFADYPDFLTRLQYSQADFHADLIQEFVQNLNKENHGLKVRRD